MRQKNSFFDIAPKVLLFLTVMVCGPLLGLDQKYYLTANPFARAVYCTAGLLTDSTNAWATAPVADAGNDIFIQKNKCSAASVQLNGGASSDPDADALNYHWYGPFAVTSGLNPSVDIPEGVYTVSLIVDDGLSLSNTDTATITVSPFFNISARCKPGKVQLTWIHIAGTERYDIYRSTESEPSNFVKIAETTSTYSTYLDEPVTNEVTYLYVVGAVSQGTWLYSNVVSSHPTGLRVISNYAPAIYSFPVVNGTVGVIYNYDVNATDPNGNTLTYSLSTSPSGMTIDQATGLIAWVPQAEGTYDVTVDVQDGNGGADAQSFTITVEELPVLNYPPLITSGALTFATEGALYAYDVEAADPDPGDELTYFLDIAPSGMGIDSSTGLITWSPTGQQFGDNSVTVRAVDKGGLYDVQSFVITVSAYIPPPTVSISASVENIQDGDIVILSWTSADAESCIIDNNIGDVGLSGSLSVTPHETTVYTIFATGPGGTVTGSATVRVNRRPVITSLPATNAYEGSLYTYEVIATDPDSDALEFSLIQAPSGMTISLEAGVISWSPSEVHIGQREVGVMVSDGKGGAATQTYYLTVTGTLDHVAPVVTIACPTQVRTSEAFNIEAHATDNTGVSKVAVYVDDMLVKENAGDACSLSFNAPEEAGAVISIRAVALDEAQNQGEASTKVTVVEAPDTNAPVITSIIAPPFAAAGESVTVRAEVTDDRGIANVRFSSAGTILGTDTMPPYEAMMTIPSGVDTVMVDVAAEDTSGNTANGQASISITDTPDTAAPSAVALDAPEQARAGQIIVVTASANDNVGVFRVEFFADGAKIGETTDVPYQTPYTIPASKPEGSHVIFTAKAWDFAGNSADSAPAYTLIVAPRDGFLVGEVYDDSTGLPVHGAMVQVISIAGQALAQPLEATSDIMGRYRFSASEGEAGLLIRKDGYSSCYRHVTVLPAAVSYPIDGRITPLGTGHIINNNTGGNIVADDNAIRLHVPSGAFSENLAVTLKTLSAQGLPGLLPAGWSPVACIHLGPENRVPNSPLDLTISRSDDGMGGLIAVRWDMTDHRWVRLETAAPSEGSGTAVSVSRMGAVAIVRPDTMPVPPPVPVIGEALSGVDLQSIPQGVNADILPSPEIIFMQPGAKSDVWVRLNNTQPLPSATPIEVDFNESYERINDSWLIPKPMTQDFILYQGKNGFDASFFASPSQIFDAALLKEGVIRLTAHRPIGTDGTGIVGPAGGIVTSPEGFSITIPAGALTSSTPVMLNPINNADPVLSGDSRFTFLGGIDLDLGGAALSTGADLSIILQDETGQDAQVLVVKTVVAEDVTRHELSAVSTISGNAAIASPAGLGLPLPGIREGGRYSFLLMNEPIGYVTGKVESGGQTVGNGIVTLNTLPFVSILSSERPDYVAASLISPVTVTGKDLTNGNNGSGATEITAVNQIVTLNLALNETRPTVVMVSPADGAGNVQLTATISVKFSRAMDGSSLTASSFIVSHNGTDIPGSISLLSDYITVIFRPNAPFEDNARYEISLSTDVKDTFGSPLFGNQPDGSYVANFTTIDITPPARPEPGQVTMTMPDDDSLVNISGTLGTVEAGVTVTAINQSTGAASSVTAEEDGSFSLRLVATVEDTVELLFKDRSGNETRYSPGVFDSGEGEAVVGTSGGILTLSDGSTFTFAPGSFDEPADVAIERITEQDSLVPTPTDFDLAFAAGFTIDTGGKQLLEPLKFRIPVSQAYAEDSKFLVSVVEEVGDENRLVLVETALYRDGAIIVNSPPMPGIGGSAYIGGGGPPIFSASQLLIHLLVMPNISFVMGNVYKAPPGAELNISVPSKVQASDEITVTASVKTFHHAVTINDLKIYNATLDSNTLGSQISASIVSGPSMMSGYAVISIDPSLVEEARSFIGGQLVIQRQKRFIAIADVTIAGTSYTLRADTSTEIVIGSSNTSSELRVGASSTEGWIPGSMKPAVGAWVQGFNGLSDKYPCITQTNYAGGFILACTPGSGYIRVFDPLTGKGTSIPVEVPYQVFGSYVEIDRIVIPEYFGDGKPPTLDVQVSGSLEVFEPLTITLNATDDQHLSHIYAKILGQSVYEDTLSGTTEVRTFDYTPSAAGDLEIVAEVYDSAGNRSTRRTMVTIKEAGLINTTDFNSVNILLEDGSINIDPEAGFYVRTDQLASGDAISLNDMRDQVDIHFEKEGDPSARIDAVGGTSCGGAFIRVYPATPLPLNTDMKMVVNANPGSNPDSDGDGGSGDGSTSGTVVHFRTKGLDTGGILLGSFREIRGLAVSGNYVYVADYGDANGIKIVNISDPTNPQLAGSHSFIRARAVAADSGNLVVVGGGGGSDVLPVLRYYSLANPTNPARIGSGVILFPLADQAIPSNVRINGSIAFVSTVGLGLQTVDLNMIREGAQMGTFQMGSAAIVGGFSLPNPEFQPNISGTSYDSALGLSGLVLTGGLDSGLVVLSATSGGFVSLIDQRPSGGTWPTLLFDYPISRLAATSDFLIRKDTNNDGAVDFYQNINLAAVSHGSSGISLVDVSDPGHAQPLGGVLNTGSRVQDMEIVDGFIFTGDRMVSIYDPENPIVSNQLSFKRPSGAEYQFTAGGDLAISTIVPISTGDRIVTFVSSDSARTGLQIGQVKIPFPGPDWDIIRTLPLEPWINPDNEDYFNTGDPVNPYTGEFVLTETDLTVPGRGLHFAFTRTYRSQNQFDGVMGFGWDHNYNSRLSVEMVMVTDPTDPDYPFKYGNVIWYDGGGGLACFNIDSNSEYHAPPGHFSELKMLTDSSNEKYFELKENDGVVLTYRLSKTGIQSRFILSSIKDRFDNEMIFEHNSTDQLTDVTDTLARNFHFSYDAKGRLTAISDYTGRSVYYAYDYDNNLIKVTDPAGKATIYTYDCSNMEFDRNGNPVPERSLNHNLLTVTDPKGQCYLQNTYYSDPNQVSFDRVDTQSLGVAPDGGTFHFTYDGDIATRKVTRATTTDRIGKTTDRNYDTDGHLTRLEEKANVDGTETTIATAYSYTPDGLVKKVVSPGGLTTEFEYNPGASSPLRKGDLTKKTITPVGGGSPRIFTYDYNGSAWGVPTVITDPSGNEIRYLLDSGGLGLVKEIQLPSATLADNSSQSIIIAFCYNRYGQILSKTAGDGVITRYVYNYEKIDPVRPADYLKTMKKIIDAGAGGVQGIERTVSGDPLQLETEFTNDTLGNVVRIKDPRGNTTNYDVNSINQIQGISDWRGNRSYSYDQNDNVERVEDLGSMVIEYNYNSLDLTTEVRQTAPDSSGSPVSRRITYGYDPNERQKSAIFPLGNTASKDLDARGFSIKTMDKLGDIRSMKYDKDGNLTAVADAEGDETTFEYNGFNELFKMTDPNGNYTEYSYDGRGILISEKQYDNSQRLLKQIDFDLDELGRTRKIREYILGGLQTGGEAQTYEMTYLYDKSGRIIRTNDSLNRATVRKYDGLGRVVYEEDAVGNTATLTYDGLNVPFRDG
ncbi:hypothetical protein PITCH_A1230001 [uncultured Desulfobacterium sp.]|uniref:PKD/Chitinase domain-containing protein n=1 Tax=uncultured Desulfobacterium sp. TaxID=201089 RepID=A0A445MRN5_9BACT|nr:hypothetical protein PITCH_A1230001 [uncultured Desulfobacterium sp.]